MNARPRLKPLHADAHLVRSKLALFERLTTEVLLQSLAPGSEHCLKTRPDGTMLDGHHRVHVLRQRGIDVDGLSRELWAADTDPKDF